MRQPINPTFGYRPRTTSSAVAITVDVFDQQPLMLPPDNSTTPPIGQWVISGGQFVDDATRIGARTMTLNADNIPPFVAPGKWLQVTIGIQRIQPVLYKLPAMIVNDITSPLDKNGGVSVEAADASAVVEGRPYEYDRSIAPAKLQTFIGETMNYALSRPVHTDQVPYVDIAKASIAEFGEGRWSVCVRVADATGYTLRLNDYGDPVARLRTEPPPPVAVSPIEQTLLPGGVRHQLRVPTAARVFVDRGNDIAPLIGKASMPDPPPAWYRPYVITDRQQGPEWWNQGYADSAAEAFLFRSLSELDRYDSLPILPSPWLEAGFDTVSFYGVTYWVSAITMQFPNLETTISLSRTVP